MEQFRVLTRIRIRTLYSLSFLVMVGTTIIMFFFTTTNVVLGLSWCIGITFAIMLTVPYVLVGKYHQIKQVRCVRCFIVAARGGQWSQQLLVLKTCSGDCQAQGCILRHLLGLNNSRFVCLAR